MGNGRSHATLHVKYVLNLIFVVLPIVYCLYCIAFYTLLQVVNLRTGWYVEEIYRWRIIMSSDSYDG